MKSLKRYLSSRHILLPRLAVRCRHRVLDAMGHRTILVYTMGKVGSSTVHQTIQSNNVSKLVYHVHFLTRENIAHISARYKNAGVPAPRMTLGQLLRGNVDHLTASNALSGLSHARKWYIVSLMRDPVATFLSHVFQNPKVHRPHLLGDEGILTKTLVQEYITKHYLEFDPDNDFISNWFDSEFCRFTGIDVFQHEFNASEGWSVISERAFVVAIVSLEKIDKALSPALSALLREEFFEDLINANERQDSKDGELYRDVKTESDSKKSPFQRICNKVCKALLRGR